MALVKVRLGVWGNYKCTVGTRNVRDTESRYDATAWLSEMLEAGHTLSDKSEITKAHVEAHRLDLASIGTR